MAQQLNQIEGSISQLIQVQSEGVRRWREYARGYTDAAQNDARGRTSRFEPSGLKPSGFGLLYSYVSMSSYTLM